MATAPPPYTEQAGYQANPPMNPNYPAGGYQPYPPPGSVDPSKGVQAGYPAQPGYAQQPQPGYPPAQYPPQQMAQPVGAAPAVPQQQGQQTIVITQGPVATGNCPICRVLWFLCHISCSAVLCCDLTSTFLSIRWDYDSLVDLCVISLSQCFLKLMLSFC